MARRVDPAPGGKGVRGGGEGERLPGKRPTPQCSIATAEPAKSNHAAPTATAATTKVGLWAGLLPLLRERSPAADQAEAKAVSTWRLPWEARSEFCWK